MAREYGDPYENWWDYINPVKWAQEAYSGTQEIPEQNPELNQFLPGGAESQAAGEVEDAAMRSAALGEDIFEYTKDIAAPGVESWERSLPVLEKILRKSLKGADNIPIPEWTEEAPGLPDFADYQGYQMGEFDRPEAFSTESVLNDPGYQFRLGEGQKAIEKSAAARGKQLSGQTMKDLAQYSQGLASDEVNRAYQRYSDDYGRDWNQYAFQEPMRAGLWDRQQMQDYQRPMDQYGLERGAFDADRAFGYGQGWDQYNAMMGQERQPYEDYMRYAEMLSGAPGQAGSMVGGAGANLGQAYGQLGLAGAAQAMSGSYGIDKLLGRAATGMDIYNAFK